MKSFSKLLSILLCLSMLIGILAMTGMAAADDTATLVTDVTTLENGDKVVFMNQAGTYAMGAVSSNGNYFTTTAATASNGTVTVEEAMQEVTVVINADNTYSFVTEADKYLVAVDESNYLRENDDLTGLAKWTVSINSDGDAEIVNTVAVKDSNSTPYWLRYNNNNNQWRFSCYGGGQQPVRLYKISSGNSGAPTLGLNKTTLIMDDMENREVTLTATKTNADDATVEWTSSKPEVATVDSTGKVTAVATGKTTVTATIYKGTENEKSATCTVKVFQYSPFASDHLDAAADLLAHDEKLPFECSATGVITAINEGYSDYHNNVTVTIQVGEKTVKCYRMTTYQSEDEDAMARYKDQIQQLKVGDKIEVTGYLAKFNQEVQFAQGCYLSHVPVINIGFAGLDAENPKVTLTVGQEVTVTPVFTPEYASTATLGDLFWMVDGDDDIVELGGAALTIKGLKVGTVTVDVNSLDPWSGHISTSFTVEVVAAENKAASVTLNKTEASVKVNGQVDLTATVTGEDANKACTDALTWESSNETIATVVDGKVTALKTGTVTITAKAGTKSATCTITVSAPTIADAVAGAAGTTHTVTGVITKIDGQSIYVQDSTAGICVRVSEAKAATLAVGGTLTATGTRGEYNGQIQLNASSANADVTYSAGTASVTPENISVDGLKDQNQNEVVKITGSFTVTEVFDNNGGWATPNITVKDANNKTFVIYKAPLTKVGGQWPIQVGATVTSVTGVLTKNVKDTTTTWRLNCNAAADIVYTNPTPSTPSTTPSTPAATTPSATTPSATTPSATTPAATTPSATTPSATTPAATTPSATTPAATTPAATTPSAPAAGTATLITAIDQLVDGQYVLVVGTGYAPGALDGSWITAVQPVVSGNKVTDAKGAVWTIKVTGGKVTLTDANGKTVAPKGGNKNGINEGDYQWDVTFADGKFIFKGVGADTVSLASNTDAQYGNKFRGYKNATVTGDPETYPNAFSLYLVSNEPATQPTTPSTPSATTPATTPSTPSATTPATTPSTPATTPATTPSTPATTPNAPTTTVTVVETPVTGTGFKFGMLQENLSKTLYITGNTANKDYYLETTENVADAVDVYLEETTGGYYIYFTKDGTKTYIDIYQSGNYVNIRLVTAPSAVFAWNSEYKTLTTKVNGEEYYMGTYKEYNTLSASKLSYASTSFPVNFYSVTTTGGTPVPPTGDTFQPMMIAMALLCVSALAVLVINRKRFI